MTIRVLTYRLGEPIPRRRWVVENRRGHHLASLRIGSRAFVVRVWRQDNRPIPCGTDRSEAPR